MKTKKIVVRIILPLLPLIITILNLIFMPYKKNIPDNTTIRVNTSYKGETIEQKIERIVNNKEPISDGAPLIYTDRKDGVMPEYDIRTDRFDVAIDAMDKVSKTHAARREERHKPKEEEKSKGEDNKGDAGTTANTSDNK